MREKKFGGYLLGSQAGTGKTHTYVLSALLDVAEKKKQGLGAYSSESMEGSDGAHSDHAGENLFTRQVATAPFPEGTFLPTLIITSPSNISQTHRILRSDFPQATVLRFWGTSSPEVSLLTHYCPGCNFSFTQEQYRGVLDGLMKHSHLPTVRPSHSDLDQSPAD